MAAVGSEERPWADLPLELVDTIMSKLAYMDQIRTSLTCKHWRTSTTVTAEKRWPLLMYLPSELDGVYKLFDPVLGRVYATGDGTSVNDRLILRASSNDGWVLLSDGCDGLLAMRVCEEECLELLDLPHLDAGRYCMDGVTFTSPPTSSDCVIFGIKGSAFDDSSVDIFLWRYGQDSWSRETCANDFPFQVSSSSPVFRSGVFYCLGRNGNLGIFDPQTANWSVLGRPKPTHHARIRDGADLYKRGTDLYKDLIRRNQERCYLVESSEGELLSIFDYSNGKPVRVMRLDETKMAWRKVEDLGGHTVFVDRTSCISVPAPSKELENRIYFTRCFCGEDDGQPKRAAYYCLENKKYYTDFRYELRKKTNCVWVLPARIYRELIVQQN